MRRDYTDSELLDALQSFIDQSRYTGKCIVRWSENGRGLRFHETELDGAVSDVRQAIKNFIQEEHGYPAK